MHDVLAWKECELSGHALHSVFPVSILYVPGAQATHSSLYVPCHPALHTQAVLDSLAIGEYVFDGHLKQSPGAYTETE